ncbi:MAG: right-handed parallel beta-helix repeat-containing protein, partial [Planctomycetota bacterium]
GTVDDVRIYNCALDISEINIIFGGKKAFKPNPSDGATNVQRNAVLSWSPGTSTVWHDVYFGDDFNDVNDATYSIPLDVYKGRQSSASYIPTLAGDTTHYWRIDEVDANNTIYKGEVWSFKTIPFIFMAHNPSPADGAAHVRLNEVLSWDAGLDAVSHDVYFGNDFNDVNDADNSWPVGTSVYKGNQDDSSFDPSGLDFETTYYWRIDEVNGSNTWKGYVWSFTTASEILVGAYYYPWYGPGGHTAFQSLREHLVPRQRPLLGDYDCASASVIAGHINQSHRGNISLWVVSWWGPGTFEDNVFKNKILTHERAGELKYAAFYESTGRLGGFWEPNYSNLLPDFKYLAKNYFSNPNYLKIDGRPVVFIYLTRVYFRGQGDAELAALRQAFPELYFVGDDVFGLYYSSKDASKWDAVTAYDVYGQSMGIYGSTQSGLNRLKDIYDRARIIANGVGVGFIPAATPGFNDKAVRTGHDAAPRYFEDNSESVEGDVFEAMLGDVVIPRVDPLAKNMLMITSFNEWHEDTQIEATRGTAGTTNLDNSGSKRYYTQGYYYSDYGYLYLDMLYEETLGQPSVQARIAAAHDGDTVVLSPGTYKERISLDGTNITLRSTDPKDPNVVAATIIEGYGSTSVVVFSRGENANCVLAGFTITGGGTGDDEGGILCEGRRTIPTISNCIIVRNGGIGIYCRDDSRPTITNCIIAGNGGSGIEAWGIESATITNCTIVENAAEGIYSPYGRPTIINCISWGNEGGAIYGSGPYVTYSNIEGGYTGIGNIDGDPCFVELGYWDANGVWIKGDYHLSEDSPCIDVGDPNFVPEPNETDIDGEPRVMGCRVDMGADEFFNIPPVACIVGGDKIIEAGSGCETRVTLDGSCSSDADSTPGTNDDINDFDWYEVIDACDPNSDVFLGSGEIIECNLPLGEHDIILEVIDKADMFDTNEVTITVEDMMAPVITLNGPEMLVLECGVDSYTEEGATGMDNCDEDIEVVIGGDTVVTSMCGTYVVTYDATDDSGNLAEQVTRTVIVE